MQVRAGCMRMRARGCKYIEEAGAFAAAIAHFATLVTVNSRIERPAMIECCVTGLLAWRDGQPGQVGNEAATAVFHQCRGSGSSPSSFFLPFFSPDTRLTPRDW